MTQTPTRKGDENMTHISRRCLICANINPCRQHSAEDQRAELARNDAEIAAIRAAPAVPQDVAGMIADLEQARELIQEAKGAEGPDGGFVTDHLDFAEHWIGKVQAALSQQPSPVAVGERCDVETNETGCLHPEVHKGSCGYSTPSEGEDDVARELLDEAYRASGYNEDGVRFARHTSADRAALAAVRTALARAGQGYGRGVRWQPIETHSGHCSPVLVCRDTPTETNRATSAFLDATGVWRVLNSESGMCPLPFVPTHWMRQPDQPSLAAPLDGEG